MAKGISHPFHRGRRRPLTWLSPSPDSQDLLEPWVFSHFLEVGPIPRRDYSRIADLMRFLCKLHSFVLFAGGFGIFEVDFGARA